MPRALLVRHSPVLASNLAAGGWPGRVERVLARGEVDRQVDGGHEPLVGAPPAQVGVGGGQELLPRHRAEHAAERAGQQQRAGGGVHPLARHVDQRHLERLAVAVGDDEVAAERGAAGRAEHHRRPPALAQLGQRALGADAVPQLDHHPVGAHAPGAELAPGVGEHVGEVGDRGDRHHDAGPGPVLHDVVDQARPPRRRSGSAAPSATAAGRRASSGRIISPGENQRSDTLRGEDGDRDRDRGAGRPRPGGSW